MISGTETNRSSWTGLGDGSESSDIDRDLQDLVGAPDENASDRRDVTVVPTPANGDVTEGRKTIVRRVRIDPTDSRAE